jgi:YHYH protein
MIRFTRTTPIPIRSVPSIGIQYSPQASQITGAELPIYGHDRVHAMGMIGFTVNGVAFYNALDDAGNDAAAHEVQDLCDGHPQGKGQYHYHSGSSCLPKGKNAVVGWALDGYPILSMYDAAGKFLTNADLDVCHRRA